MKNVARAVLIILLVSQIQAEDVNKNLPFYCNYVKDDVTYLKCEKIGIQVYDVLKQLWDMPSEERARVEHFHLNNVDMPALRSRTFQMFQNLKKLDVTKSRTFGCASDALQGIPKLEELWLNLGTSTEYNVDGLFANMNLKWVKLDSTFKSMESVDTLLKGLKQYKLDYFECEKARIPWANLTYWFQGESLKTLILSDLNAYFDLYAKPIDDPDSLKSFTNLEALVLSQNRINEIADGAFRFQSKLKTLNLQKNWLRKINPGMFQGLDQMTELDLSYNFLVVVAIEDFGNAWHTEPLLTVNLRNNRFECGCNMTENAQDFNNTGYQLVVENFQCAGPALLKNKYITDIETIQSNLTSDCEPPVLSNCCPNDDTIEADPSEDNKVEIMCTATGVPAPKVWCEPISGSPMPKELTPWYYEEETYNSFVSRWYYAETKQSGIVRCWATNPSGVVSKDCTILIKTVTVIEGSGIPMTPGGMSMLVSLFLTVWLFEHNNT